VKFPGPTRQKRLSSFATATAGLALIADATAHGHRSPVGRLAVRGRTTPVTGPAGRGPWRLGWASSRPPRRDLRVSEATEPPSHKRPWLGPKQHHGPMTQSLWPRTYPSASRPAATAISSLRNQMWAGSAWFRGCQDAETVNPRDLKGSSYLSRPSLKRFKKRSGNVAT
jgi:hypothetical protein